ncbi:hypothetical protein Ancab_028488, partial [Ancistrocladus abbreviatus]
MVGFICAVTSFVKLSCQASIGSRASIGCQAEQLALPSVQPGFIRANCSGGDCCCLEAVSRNFSGGAQSLAGVVVSEGIALVEAFDDSAALLQRMTLLGLLCLVFSKLSRELVVYSGRRLSGGGIGVLGNGGRGRRNLHCRRVQSCKRFLAAVGGFLVVRWDADDRGTVPILVF